MKRPLWDALPRWLLTWLICFALSQGLGQALHADCRWWLAASALLAWCCVLAVAERFGRFWAMLALWAVALGLCLLLSDRTLLTEAATALLSRAGAQNFYSELLLLMLCATAALPLSALLRIYWAHLALSIAWIALWIAAALLEWPLPRTVPAALLPLLLMTAAETICHLRGDPEPGERLRRALLLSLLPAALLLALLPAPAEPYDYPLLHSVAETVEKLWYDAETGLRYRRRGEQVFGISFNGVTDDAELGEGGEQDSRSLIYVKSAIEPDGALYIFGNAWDSFDGRGWSSSLRPEAAESLKWSLDTAEHVYALWRMLGAEERQTEFFDYFRNNSVYLNIRNMNVRTMFNVMNAAHIYTDEERFPYSDAPTGSLFDYVQQDDAWYRVYYLEPNSRTLGKLIAASEGKVYDAKAHAPLWRSVAQDFEDIFELDLWDGVNLEKTLAERTELIRGAYLDSSCVSERARALAEEITTDCGSDYERLAAISAYLQKNYSYSLRPDPVPEDENFLDWLLFEGREGYCTWYATAAVLLSRSVGVPARYVQGYRCDGLPAGEFTPLGNDSAHAWCEGYIAGYGWVTMEATPGFGGGGTGWAPAAEGKEPNGVEPAPASAPGKEQTPAGDAESGEALPAPHVPGSDAAEAEEPALEPAPGPAHPWWLAVLIPAALLAALAIVWLSLRARRRRCYSAAEPAERLRLDLETLLRDLRGKGYPRRPEEPLRRYFERLPWRFLLASEAEAEEMAALYDRTFFGQETPGEIELERHRAFAARFRPRTLRQWAIWLRMQ